MGRQRISRFTNLSPKNGGLRASDIREAAPLSLLIKSAKAVVLSAPHTANTFFAKSIPIVVTSISDPPRFVRMSLSTSWAHCEAVYKRAGVHTVIYGSRPRGELARPALRSAAGLHPHHAARQPSHEAEYLPHAAVAGALPIARCTLPRRSAYRLRVERLQRRRNLLGNRRDPWFVTGETRRLNCGTGPLEPPGNWNLVVGNV